MPTQPIKPPTHVPVRDLRTANHKDGFYWELVSRESTEFIQNAPIKRGTKYSDIIGARADVIALYPSGLWFCSEIVPLRSSEVGGMPGERLVIWVWSSDRLAQSPTNADITYAEESVSHPSFARDSLIRRDLYQTNPTLAAASSLTAIIGVTITAAGTGYTSASGTIGTGATVEFVCSGGAIISGIVTNEGTGVTSGGSITITGTGTGATATAVIQPAGAVLVHQEKRELAADDPLSHEFVRVIRIYKTEPGPILTSQSYSGEFRGRLVDTIVQEGLDGTLPPETGSYIISSVTEQLDSVLERRTTKKLNGATYPADEIWYDYQYVSIPRRIFSLTPTYLCNGTDQGVTVTFNPVTLPGGSYIRKHRTTVSYSAAPPGDTGLSVFTVADLDYDGRIINHHFHGVLNDAISLDQDFIQGTCTWDEVYDFPASDPSATDFGDNWWLVSRQTSDIGTTGWRTVTVEFYEPAI